MKALVIILGLLIGLLLAVYGLYRFVFCYPAKKHPDARQIPDSSLYKAYKDVMLDTVEEMENTPWEEVGISSVEGFRLSGKLYCVKKDAPLLIFFHGYHGMAQWDGYGFFRLCRKNGINILLTDERAHGSSEGKAITFGIRERYDCKAWAEYAADRFGRTTDIFLAGVSMGAASVMMASALGLPENVRAVVADCGFSEPSAIVKEILRKNRLPVPLIYPLILLGGRIFGHFDLEEASALAAVKNMQLPILFLHGLQDSVVPPAMSEELYHNCSGPKERVWIEGADHANSAMTDYAAYERAVMNFLRKYAETTGSSTEIA